MATSRWMHNSASSYHITIKLVIVLYYLCTILTPFCVKCGRPNPLNKKIFKINNISTEITSSSTTILKENAFAFLAKVK